MLKISSIKGGNKMWIVFALLSALFAALTSILAKIGIDGVNSNLATNAYSCCTYYGLGTSFPYRSTIWN